MTLIVSLYCSSGSVTNSTPERKACAHELIERCDSMQKNDLWEIRKRTYWTVQVLIGCQVVRWHRWGRSRLIPIITAARMLQFENILTFLRHRINAARELDAKSNTSITPLGDFGGRRTSFTPSSSTVEVWISLGSH